MLLNDGDVITREVTEWQGLHLFHFDLSLAPRKCGLCLRTGFTFHTSPHQLNEGRTTNRLVFGYKPSGRGTRTRAQRGRAH